MINKIITNCGYGIAKIKNPCLDVIKKSCTQMKPSLMTDVFEYSKKACKKFPEFDIEKKFFNTNQEMLDARAIVHKKRMELFAPKDLKIEPKAVSKEKIKAIRAVQFEESEYNHVQDKLRKNIPLNEKEQDFYYFILDSMEDTESSRVLWRNVAPYDGFVEQIRQGELDFKGLSSTASNYTDFFDFWQCADVGVVGKKLQVQESYMLKINVKKGTPVLDCSAIHKRAFRKPIYPRMYGEVVLPEGKGIVKSIDNDLRIIEVDFCM